MFKQNTIPYITPVAHSTESQFTPAAQ